MKKFMRIALVFALAGATLVGCTKDYSGDISDLNKKVSEQSAALSALQSQVANAQTAADAAAQKAAEALAEAQKKATPADVQAAEERVNAKINDLVSGDVKALKDAVAALEEIKADGRLTDLETAIKDFVTKAELAQELATLKGELEEAIAAGDKVNADAIAELEKKVNKLLADAITIAAPAGQVIVNYDYATFNLPNDLTNEPYKSLVAAFPEVKAFKGNQITQGGHVPFTVNPESTEFDETFTYEFVGLDGKTFGTLSDPVEGFVGVSSANAGEIQTKSANGFWTLSFAPTMEKSSTNKLIVAEAEKEPLSLVITKGDTRAATTFAYKAAGADVTATTLNVTYDNGQQVIYAESIDLLNAKYYNAAGQVTTGKIVNMVTALNGKFIISAAAGEQNALDIEKYGVEFGKPGESTIKVTKFPENMQAISFNIHVAYIGLNGNAYDENFTLTVTNAISADGVLAAKEVTLDGKKNAYPVRWNLADYDFTKAQLKALVEASSKKLSFTYVDPETGKVESAQTQDIAFYKKDGVTPTSAWSEAVSFGFDLAPATYWPDEYTVTLRIFNGPAGTTTDITVYAAESTITVTNDADVIEGAVKLLDAVCDEDGTLLAVGSANGSTVTYNFANAFVVKSIAEITGYKDLEYDKYAGESVANYNWIKEVNFGTEAAPINRPVLQIPANGQKDAQDAKYNYVNNVTRHIRANISYFGNSANVGYVDFNVKVISPVYSETGASLSVTDATIAFGKSVELNTILGVKGTYVVGPDATKEFQLLQTWKKKGDTPATYIYYIKDENAYNAPSISGDNDKRPALANDHPLYVLGVAVNGQGNYVFDANDDPIVFDTFDKAYLKLFNSGITTSQIQAINEWRAGEDYKPVYLTNRMFKQFAKVWAKYYDCNGKAYTIKLDNVTYFKESYKQIWLAQDNTRVWDEQYWAALLSKKTEDINGYLGGEENRLAATEILETDEVAVALFEEYKDLVKAEDEPVVPGEGYTTDKAPSSDVKKVTVKFDDPDVAAKFVNPATGFENPYSGENEHSVKISANANYSPADLNGKTSVDVTGTVEVLDAWGMTTKKAFKITCKIPTE